MVEKQEWKDHRKRDPESELLVNRHVRKGIQNEKARHRDRNGGCVIDINCAHEIALLPFELQAAVETIVVHGEGASI
jgi:LytS/YehU family sensor histidine kinase